MADLKVHKCGDCGVRIVIMDTATGSILPVEVEDGKVFTDDDTFNYRIHKSHLLKCFKLRDRWMVFQKRFFKQQENKLALTKKDLLQ